MFDRKFKNDVLTDLHAIHTLLRNIYREYRIQNDGRIRNKINNVMNDKYKSIKSWDTDIYIDDQVRLFEPQNNFEKAKEYLVKTGKLKEKKKQKIEVKDFDFEDRDQDIKHTPFKDFKVLMGEGIPVGVYKYDSSGRLYSVPKQRFLSHKILKHGDYLYTVNLDGKTQKETGKAHRYFRRSELRDMYNKP